MATNNALGRVCCESHTSRPKWHQLSGTCCFCVACGESGHCRYLLDALPHYSFVPAQEGTSREVYTPESSYKPSIQYVMIVKVGSQIEGLWCCSQCALGFQIREHSVHYFCPLCHFSCLPFSATEMRDLQMLPSTHTSPQAAAWRCSQRNIPSSVCMLSVQ